MNEDPSSFNPLSTAGRSFPKDPFSPAPLPLTANKTKPSKKMDQFPRLPEIVSNRSSVTLNNKGYQERLKQISNIELGTKTKGMNITGGLKSSSLEKEVRDIRRTARGQSVQIRNAKKESKTNLNSNISQVESAVVHRLAKQDSRNYKTNEPKPSKAATSPKYYDPEILDRGFAKAKEQTLPPKVQARTSSQLNLKQYTSKPRISTGNGVYRNGSAHVSSSSQVNSSKDVLSPYLPLKKQGTETREAEETNTRQSRPGSQNPTADNTAEVKSGGTQSKTTHKRGSKPSQGRPDLQRGKELLAQRMAQSTPEEETQGRNRRIPTEKPSSKAAAEKTAEKQAAALIAQKLQERNEKYLEQLAKKRAQAQGKNQNKEKKEQEKRQKIREQLAKQNAEVIKARQEEKQKEEEEKKRAEDEKKKELKALEGPSKEFLERLHKSNKVKQPPITDWNVYRKRHNLSDEQKIFICSNAYQPLIKELLARGWHRNKERKSGIFHLKFVILDSESSMMEDLKPWQMVNHFLGNNLITAKVGLQKSLKSLIWWSTVPQDQFFPKCYNLTDFKEVSEFQEDFRVNRAESILKRFVKKREFNSIEKLLVAINVNEKRLMDTDQYIDDPSLENLVTEDEWHVLEKVKVISDDYREALHNEEWYRLIHLKYQHLCQGPLVEKTDDCVSDEDPIEEESNEDDDQDEGDSYSEDEGQDAEEKENNGDDGSPMKQADDDETEQEGQVSKQEQQGSQSEKSPKKEKEFQPIENTKGQYQALFDYVSDMCDRLREKFTQFNMNGTENLWLLKPGCSSRGRGIKVYKSYDKVVNRINMLKGNTRLWVVQKCIENPLIVQDRKFDIRQWVLVTDWNPLTIWCYRESYVRFCVQEYDSKSDTRKNHLTNNSVQKKYADIAEADGLMWSSEEFAEHLDEEFGDDPWTEKIWPQIKKYVKASAQSVQDQVDNRKNSFEFFGYDFMVDTDLRVWLIEVNASPSMDMGTSVTSRLVQDVLVDLCKVIIDYPAARNKKDVDTGGFCLVYRSNVEVQRPQAVNLQNIFCEGKKIEQKKKKPKPKKQVPLPQNRQQLYPQPPPRKKKAEVQLSKELEKDVDQFITKETHPSRDAEILNEINDLHQFLQNKHASKEREKAERAERLERLERVEKPEKMERIELPSKQVVLELSPKDEEKLHHRQEKSIRADKILRGPKPAKMDKGPSSQIYKLDQSFVKDKIQAPTAQFSFLGNSAAGSSLQVISAEPQLPSLQRNTSGDILQMQVGISKLPTSGGNSASATSKKLPYDGLPMDQVESFDQFCRMKAAQKKLMQMEQCALITKGRGIDLRSKSKEALLDITSPSGKRSPFVDRGFGISSPDRSKLS